MPADCTGRKQGAGQPEQMCSRFFCTECDQNRGMLSMRDPEGSVWPKGCDLCAVVRRLVSRRWRGGR